MLLKEMMRLGKILKLVEVKMCKADCLGLFNLDYLPSVKLHDYCMSIYIYRLYQNILYFWYQSLLLNPIRMEFLCAGTTF